MKGGLLVLNWRSLLRVNQVTFSNSEDLCYNHDFIHDSLMPCWVLEVVVFGISSFAVKFHDFSQS